MIFNRHSNLDGMHSTLSPSTPHWMNYDDYQFDAFYAKKLAAALGTRKHEWAAESIRLGIKMEERPLTLNLYVNDAIGFKMRPEQALFYSEHAFGTADAIGFRHNKLRVHDLKTGVTPTSEKQLEGYDALFCLEYGHSPLNIEIENRIYQNDEVRIYIPDPNDIMHIMDTIKVRDRRIREMRLEAFR